MATNTYVALSTQTVGTAVASVTFTSIPQTYTDLVLVVNGTTAGGIQFRLNSDPGNNYSHTRLWTNGSAMGNDKNSNQGYIYTGDFSTNTSTGIYNFQNYSNANTFKTVLSSVASAGNSVWKTVGLWRSNFAIDTILVASGTGNIAVGTTLTLYGIASANNFTKATGGIISEDSTYTYHVFGATGTFTPKQALTADILVVAGGGSGSSGQSGTYYGFGGGAGEVKYFASQSLASGTAYTCTVGAGGASIGNSTINVNGNAGTVSTFGALTSAIAGSGANYNSPGGSSGNGFTGGAGSPTAGGGGAGAGANGSAASGGNTPGAGGNGISTYSSWGIATSIGQNISGTYYLAGGGGGVYTSTVAAGGYGGGGGGGSSTTQFQRNGLANTGSGGSGGGDTAGNSGAGGSGVVIIRYPK